MASVRASMSAPMKLPHREDPHRLAAVLDLCDGADPLAIRQRLVSLRPPAAVRAAGSRSVARSARIAASELRPRSYRGRARAVSDATRSKSDQRVADTVKVTRMIASVSASIVAPCAKSARATYSAETALTTDRVGPGGPYWHPAAPQNRSAALGVADMGPVAARDQKPGGGAATDPHERRRSTKRGRDPSFSPIADRRPGPSVRQRTLVRPLTRNGSSNTNRIITGSSEMVLAAIRPAQSTWCSPMKDCRPTVRVKCVSLRIRVRAKMNSTN